MTIEDKNLCAYVEDPSETTVKANVTYLKESKECKGKYWRALAQISTSIFLKENWLTEGVYFTGHGLNNKDGGKNKYTKLTLSECQELCEITENCFYFNHVDNNCFPKSGMGKKCSLSRANDTGMDSNGTMKGRCPGIKSKKKAYFGHKYSKGIT